MHDLIERADLGHPVAFEPAVVVLADVARYGARRLDHIAKRPGLYGVGSQLIDHGVPSNFLPLTFISPRLPLTPQVRGEGEEKSPTPRPGHSSPPTLAEWRERAGRRVAHLTPRIS